MPAIKHGRWLPIDLNMFSAASGRANTDQLLDYRFLPSTLTVTASTPIGPTLRS